MIDSLTGERDLEASGAEMGAEGLACVVVKGACTEEAGRVREEWPGTGVGNRNSALQGTV